MPGPEKRSAVDYELAVATARRLAPAPPQVSWAEAGEIVDELRSLAVQAEEHVRAVTGLVPPGDILEATVVDRPGWAAANVEGFQVVLEPLTDKLAAKAPNALAAGVTAKVAGVQMGSLLAWLSSKVLGQYEAFRPEGESGRLILVAPNIVETERRLGVDPHDFRLWVALHEVTHRTQFTAVPWMHDHVRSEISTLLEAASLDDPAQLIERLKAVATGLPRGGSMIELLQTPEQKVVLDRVTAFMSLLEGHAEHVMDGVGPAVVPTVKHIRTKFDERRKEHGGLIDKILRRALGLDLKALQYAEGKVFVDTCVREVGMTGFNRVWESPATLPTREEIRAPLDWVRRIHGPKAIPA
ncbi:MAG: zinc-dependent metalloprotease [Actinobacteria bacterium]|nr:zinc-dependent metalloprotease [Actinomycetota bacterium]MBW3648447.1 zinc-dependent metalloprotease [Actinomycetota bacterium]